MADTIDPKETNEIPQQQQPPQQETTERPKEKVGDILHKERVTRRITLETIAKDMKLNIKYIKAIEANSFTEIPADPYIRVYLRSIASYLSLDPEEILKKFFEEKGYSELEKEVSRSEKININLEKDKQKQSNAWVFIVIIVMVLAVLSFVSKRMGWIATTSEEPAPVAAVADSAADTTSVSPADSPLVEQTMAEDSVADSLYTEEEIKQEQDIIKKNAPLMAALKKDTLKLVISATIDSVWVQVFYDNKSWKNFVRTKEPRYFSAKDSINIHVGNNSILKYTLNGKKLPITGGSVRVFKIDRNGVEIWNMSKWKTVFKDRL